MKGRLSRYGILLAGMLLSVLLGVTACMSAPTSASAPTPECTVLTISKADSGDYLVDAKGMTLYYFTKDSAGKSSATAPVIANWPIFYAASIVVLSNLNASDFGTITGFEGQMQTTYKGWPLYYYIKDQAAGDTLGQGVNGVWFVINPQSVPLPPSGS
jgi:predicted lipoprotein with Yx(FWY)xxD motif